jgi:hypothetical protein
MDVRYLSEDYWKQVGAALDAAKQLAFTLNFADEYDWPSAHAWDRFTGKPELSEVLLKHPEFPHEAPASAEFRLEGPQGWSWECPETPEAVVAARMDANGRLEESWVRGCARQEPVTALGGPAGSLLWRPIGLSPPSARTTRAWTCSTRSGEGLPRHGL